jgi:riboflavin biosynthesis pyrimidine reductase
MRQLLPTQLDAVDPFELFAGDERAAAPDRPWVLANMITSLDGATHVDGLSGGLGSEADRVTFRAIRAVADVILVAAGTARSEQYHPVRTNPDVVDARLARGQRERPRLAILTRHLDLDLDGELFTSPDPPIVLTTEHAPQVRVRYAESRTDVVQFPGDRVDVAEAVRALGALGARIVLSEGGPTLIGQLALADVLDELCLSLSPLIVGGDAARVTDVPVTTHRTYELCRVLEDASMLLLRYVRSNEPAPGAP